MKRLCLIGYPLEHSFSKFFYNREFQKKDLDWEYFNLEIKNLENLLPFIETHKDLIGFNVTSPHKEAILNFLTEISDEAKQVNAVNTVIIEREPYLKLIGFNTDIYGFKKSLENFLDHKNLKALVLGSGGAARAVIFVLKKMKIPYLIVSRTKGDLRYEDLNQKIICEHKLIINATPLGMFPNVEQFPALPYEYVGEGHYFYDLIYNPEETEFLKKAKQNGAKIKNGYEMLILQAQKALEIFQKKYK